MTSYTRVEEIEVLVYVAEDGTEFYDEQECLAYESRQHVSNGVKNVFVYFDEGINGKGIYAIHSLKDFTSLSYVLGLSRTNQEIQGSDISYKSVTATFDRYPFVILHNPVTQMFKIQTVEKFKERYEIDKIIEKMKELENIMVPLEDTPVTPPVTGDGDGDGEENKDDTESGTKPPVTPPTEGGDDGTESGNNGNESGGDGNETGEGGSENNGNESGEGGDDGDNTDPEKPSTGDNGDDNESGEGGDDGDNTDPEKPSTGDNGDDNEGNGEGDGNESGGDGNETGEGGSENNGNESGEGGDDTDPENPSTGGDDNGEGGDNGDDIDPESPEGETEGEETEEP